MKDNMDKSLFFMTLSLVCIWLLVDMAIGKNYLTNFLAILFPFMESSGRDVSMTKEEQKEASNNAPSSSAMGQNKAPGSGESSGISSNAITGGNGTGYGVRSK